MKIFSKKISFGELNVLNPEFQFSKKDLIVLLILFGIKKMTKPNLMMKTSGLYNHFRFIMSKRICRIIIISKTNSKRHFSRFNSNNLYLFKKSILLITNNVII